MTQEYWQQQASDKMLFPKMIWSRPETKHGAGKLLIIGGQEQEFIHVAESFAASQSAGAGTVRVFMPESTRKLTKMLPNVEYAPSNSSGSFAKEALSELLEAGLWSDGVLLAGDIGKNSETNLMIENFISKYTGQLIINGLALVSVTTPPYDLFNRENTIISLNRNELQKLLIEIKYQTPLTSKTTNPDLAKILHELTNEFKIKLLVVSDKVVWTAATGNVASTITKEQRQETGLAAIAAVWAIQNPGKMFEALTTSIVN